MYLAYKNGISPREFRKCYKKDLFDCVDIDGAINQKEIRQAEINKMLSKVRF